MLRKDVMLLGPEIATEIREYDLLRRKSGRSGSTIVDHTQLCLLQVVSP